MRRLIGTNVFARNVAQLAPGGYMFVPPGFGWHPGHVLAGPYTDTTTTVVLRYGDDGQWFIDLVKKAGGTIREE